MTLNALARCRPAELKMFILSHDSAITPNTVIPAIDSSQNIAYISDSNHVKGTRLLGLLWYV